MNNIVDFTLSQNRGKYVPVARYNALGDFVEYIRQDRPHIMRRIDDFLTIALDIETRQPAGFRLKGFKNFYLQNFPNRVRLLDDQFVALVATIEVAATLVGDVAFATTSETKGAYKSACAIATEDQVRIQPSALAA